MGVKECSVCKGEGQVEVRTSLDEEVIDDKEGEDDYRKEDDRDFIGQASLPPLRTS